MLSSRKTRNRASLHSDCITASSSIINPTKSCNESIGNWSWTSSNELDELEEEEMEDEEHSRSSSSVTVKTYNYILQKIIDSRKVYQDLQDTGYFSHIIYTDDLNQAYDNLKNVVCHIYNTKDDWSSLYSFEKDPLYKEVVNTKAKILMDLLDKTESTASLNHQ